MDLSLPTVISQTPPTPAPAVDLSELKAAADHAMQDAKVKFDALLKDGHTYIKANPGKSVVAALAAGFVLGMIFKD